MSRSNHLTIPEATDLPALAKLWQQGWNESHIGNVPEELVALRTYENFLARLEKARENTRMVQKSDTVLGFCTINGAELYQLFVAPDARGSGIAKLLLEDGETRIRASGIATPHLYCVIGNDRAAHFYEKNGWTRHPEPVVEAFETTQGPFSLKIWKFTKSEMSPTA